VEDDASMVSPSQMALLMVDWTDPQKAMYEFIPRLFKEADVRASEIRGSHIDETVHIELASSILESLLSQEMEGENDNF
jgi:hypothetical protein